MNQLLSECVADCELAAAIEARSRVVQVSSKRVLFRQDHPPSQLYLLQTGEVILTSRLADKSVMGFRAVPGSLIGLPASLSRLLEEAISIIQPANEISFRNEVWIPVPRASSGFLLQGRVGEDSGK
jgi:CRP-like cAMP-binding protein